MKNTFVGWSNKRDRSPDRILWITNGKCLGDFFGTTVGVFESDVPELIKRLTKLLPRKETAMKKPAKPAKPKSGKSGKC